MFYLHHSSFIQFIAVRGRFTKLIPAFPFLIIELLDALCDVQRSVFQGLFDKRLTIDFLVVVLFI